MKKFIVLFLMICVVGSFGFVVKASEITTETITTQEVTTVPEVTETPVVDDIFEEPLLDNVAPKVQFGIQIFSFVYTIGATLLIFKQRIDVAVAKRREKEAKENLTAEEGLRKVQMNSLNVILDVLNIITQNSKITPTEKINITELITTAKTQNIEVLDLVSQITNMDKTDISDILDSIKDIANIATAGYTAVKTGDLSKLVINKDEVGE